jgi:hypothetical protein
MFTHLGVPRLLHACGDDLGQRLHSHRLYSHVIVRYARIGGEVIDYRQAEFRSLTSKFFPQRPTAIVSTTSTVKRMLSSTQPGLLFVLGADSFAV